MFKFLAIFLMLFPIYSYADDVDRYARKIGQFSLSEKVFNSDECFVSFEKYKLNCGKIVVDNHKDFKNYQLFSPNMDYIFIRISNIDGHVEMISNNVFTYNFVNDVKCDISFNDKELTCRLKNNKEKRIIAHYFVEN